MLSFIHSPALTGIHDEVRPGHSLAGGEEDPGVGRVRCDGGMESLNRQQGFGDVRSPETGWRVQGGGGQAARRGAAGGRAWWWGARRMPSCLALSSRGRHWGDFQKEAGGGQWQVHEAWRLSEGRPRAWRELPTSRPLAGEVGRAERGGA